VPLFPTIAVADAGENSIIIVGGANQSSWELGEGAKAAIQGAGAVLLQREIPEQVNVQVAQVGRHTYTVPATP
jgi:ribokinase